MKTRIGIQGQNGSFHSIAATLFFGKNIRLLPCDTFAEVFMALQNNECDKAIVAIENSLYGSINNVYDLLLKKHIWICGEIYLHVNQCLVGLPNTKFEAITEVHSQGPALGQCEAFLDLHVPQAKRIEQHDTAASVAMIKEWNDPKKVAIASREAAQIHGLTILAEEIETHTDNFTRFVVIQSNEEKIADADKTSLILTTDHRPGALYNALSAFKEQNINLTKLQSRPVVGKKWHYMFYIDVAAGAQSRSFKAALKKLREQKCDVTILGSYKAGTI